MTNKAKLGIFRQYNVDAWETKCKMYGSRVFIIDTFAALESPSYTEHEGYKGILEPTIDVTEWNREAVYDYLGIA